tara:strand:- start:1301 stop:1810 length:510 start_codon:yes stop_codon:yes gene_type:complete
MTIKVVIDDTDATVSLNARKSLDGNLMIFDHDQIDIVVMHEKKKVVAFPKTDVTEDVYTTQDRLFSLLSKRGVISHESVQSGNIFNSLEGEILESNFANSLQAAVYVISEFITTEKETLDRAEKYQDEIEKHLVNPADEHSTELGEVPQEPEKGSIRPGYYYTPLRYRY